MKCDKIKFIVTTLYPTPLPSPFQCPWVTFPSFAVMHVKNDKVSVNNCSYRYRDGVMYILLTFTDEMLDTESRGVAGRVADLERKVLEQGDELVCLKATLAEVLRRLNILEGMRNPGNASSTPSTPVRINGNTSLNNVLRQRPSSHLSGSKVENVRKLVWLPIQLALYSIVCAF